jgi:MSHA biogenesis protein MshJ
MTRRWAQFVARIDALTLRERVLLFAAASAVVVLIAYFAGLGPMLAAQSTLRVQIRQQQNNLAGLDGEIEQKVKEYQRDPDARTRERLATVQAESVKLGDSLRAMQKGLVAPERMAPLIDTILRSNGRLQLVSMKTLPVGSLNDAAKADTPNAAAPAATPASAALPPKADVKVEPKPGSLLYRHGVEISVRGNYLDMINYMAALESLPTQLFWGGARLEVEEYPAARLTLTLYTLSLDPKWMKL